MFVQRPSSLFLSNPIPRFKNCRLQPAHQWVRRAAFRSITPPLDLVVFEVRCHFFHIFMVACWLLSCCSAARSVNENGSAKAASFVSVSKTANQKQRFGTVCTIDNVTSDTPVRGTSTRICTGTVQLEIVLLYLTKTAPYHARCAATGMCARYFMKCLHHFPQLNATDRWTRTARC